MNYYDRLLRQIWITKNSRIKTFKRLESYDSWSQGILIYYSIIITIFSIWNFYLEKTNKIGADSTISVVLLIISITLTILSVYITSKSFKERAIRMKSHYLALDGLHRELFRQDDLLKTNKISAEILLNKAADIDKNYLKLLDTVENHNQYDYLKALSEDKNESLNIYQKIKFAGYIIVDYGVKILSIAIPTLLIYYVYA